MKNLKIISPRRQQDPHVFNKTLQEDQGHKYKLHHGEEKYKSMKKNTNKVIEIFKEEYEKEKWQWFMNTRLFITP
jgi:hypothetical protein